MTTTTNTNPNKRGYSPIRLNKIEEVRQMLQDMQYELIKQGINKPLTIKEKLESMLRYRVDVEDGLSIKEIAFIFYLTEQMSISTIDKTRQMISKFRKSGIDVVLYPRQTAKGEWLYYDVQRFEEWKEIDARLARIPLGSTRSIQKTEEIVTMSKKELLP